MANILKNNVTINFGDKVWSSDEKFNSFPAALVHVLSEATFEGVKGGIDMYSLFSSNGYNAKDDGCYAITVGDMKMHDENDNRTTIATDGKLAPQGKLTINGGIYQSVGSVVYVANGVCEINDGIFFGQPDSSQKSKSDAEREKYGDFRNFSLNLYDSFGKRGDSKIIVRGGSFIGFDPADNYAEGDGTNFVAKGYKSVENGEYTYLVKDINREDNGSMVTVKVYTVVPSTDQRDGIEGVIA